MSGVHIEKYNSNTALEIKFEHTSGIVVGLDLLLFVVVLALYLV